jgi:DNA-binding transcriptional LysR family regulator
MEFKQLKYFVGVAEALHFSNAAKKLYVSQSALSQQILLLENEIGTALFEREKRTKQHKVALTEAGAVFLIDAKKMLQLHEKSIETARRVGLRQETIRFGIFKTALKQRLELITLFTKNFPDIDLKIVELSTYGEVQKNLMEGQIDIGFTFLPIQNKDLTAKIYQKGTLSLILPQTHRFAKKNFLTLKDLQNEKWIEIDKSTNPVLERIEWACQEAGFNRAASIVQVVTGLELMYSLVSLGIGIALGPSFLDLKKEPNLVLKPLFNADGSPFNAIEVSLALAYKTEHARPLILALMGLIKEA